LVLMGKAYPSRLVTSPLLMLFRYMPRRARSS
jgi:hypothetical protein